MNVNEVLIKPIITEKTTLLQENNQYVFKVDNRASKNTIKDAIKKIYNLDAVKVNIICVDRKRKGMRHRNGVSPSWKKAIISFKEGDKIDFFEN